MNTQNQSSKDSPREISRGETAFVEVPGAAVGIRPDTRDVLKRLQANLDNLEDLTGRLSFMMNEIRSLIGRK